MPDWATTPDWLTWGGIWDAALLIAAIVVAIVALWSDRIFRREESLARLLERFEANEFFVRMWRFDQITREGLESWSIEPKDTHALTHDPRVEYRTLSLWALASDWKSPRADMYQVYFFALRVQAWLGANRRGWRRRTARRINDTFGHQLLSTLLDHRINACRLRDKGRAVSYFPTHYGLLDPRYTRVVNALADDLLSADGRLPSQVRKDLERKRDAVADYLERHDMQAPSTDDAPVGLETAEAGP